MFRFGKKKEIKEETEKIDETSKSLIEGFDEVAYLDANPDVKEGIENGQFKDALHHLDLYGLAEIKQGLRKFNQDFTVLNESTESSQQVLINYFDEQGYLDTNPDVEEGISNGNFRDALHHLELFGLNEIANGQRKFHKDFEPFNEILYLTKFEEVSNAIERGNFSSPFEHFCLYGYDEIIKEERDWQKVLLKKERKRINIKSEKDYFVGVYEYSNGFIEGWFYSKDKADILITVDNIACKIKHIDSYIPDIAQNFTAEFPSDIKNAQEIKIFSITEEEVQEVYTQKITINKIAPKSLKLLKTLKQISSKKDAVVIVVWDATHNPIARAKVLYDSLKKNRPVIIVAFDFQFSNTDIWKPLISSSVNILTINWDEKEIFRQIVDEMGITFKTVWLCKPRLPTFILGDILSDTTSKFILDIDDNEKALSATEEDISKPYGLLSNYLAEVLTDNISVKSVVSIAIQKKWGGEFVRHARDIKPQIKTSKIDLHQYIKIGFFGTVRPHKNLEQAAQAIAMLQESTSLKVKLIVAGEFIPAMLEKDISKYGAETQGMIENDKLSLMLEDIDILLAGFPSEENEISKYQISSKIADALSIGKPILVPEGESTSDLDEINGIYLFNKNNFIIKLIDVINNKETIDHDKIFTFDENYKQFLKLEELASLQKKKEIYTVPLGSSLQLTKQKIVPTLVLVWKQPDSSLYGRRVDQIARSYKKQYPNHKVIILEMVDKALLEAHRNNQNIFVGDDAMLLERIREKIYKYKSHGVEHILLLNDEDIDLRNFLLVNRILPTNSIFILFPILILSYFENLIEMINGYKIIVDIVDNQFSWETPNIKQLVKQYKIATSLAKTIVFASKKNQDYFYAHNFIDETSNTIQITNWYELPESMQNKSFPIKSKEKINIFYSGNMNDRIDWDLIKNLLNAVPDNVTLYLIGNAQRAVHDLNSILSQYKNCIYLGPLDESTLLNLMQTCHFSIMPHTVDEVSMYMNPIKIHMYTSMGIKCISTDVSGLDCKSSNLLIANDTNDFIQLCLDTITDFQSATYMPLELQSNYVENRDVYMKLIENLRMGE